jgi:predicted nucleotidyltransferase component of viral defense system
MLDRNDIERYGPPGFHLAQKEKDYAQHWALAYLSRSGFEGIFKGGTCLQKAFGLPRYSEDLDFTLNGEREPDFEAMSAFLSSAGFSGLALRKESTGVSVSTRLRYRGPLYSGVSLSEGTILFEFSKREKTLLEAQIAVITPPYPDLLPYPIRVAALDEIAAEKVRAILTRFSARDLFDLYFLINKKARVDRDLVNAKLEYYGVKFDGEKFGQKVKKLESVWGKEMKALTPNVLEYGIAAKTVLESLKKK